MAFCIPEHALLVQVPLPLGPIYKQRDPVVDIIDGLDNTRGRRNDGVGRDGRRGFAKGDGRRRLGLLGRAGGEIAGTDKGRQAREATLDAGDSVVPEGRDAVGGCYDKHKEDD